MKMSGNNFINIDSTTSKRRLEKFWFQFFFMWKHYTFCFRQIRVSVLTTSKALEKWYYQKDVFWLVNKSDGKITFVGDPCPLQYIVKIYWQKQKHFFSFLMIFRLFYFFQSPRYISTAEDHHTSGYNVRLSFYFSWQILWTSTSISAFFLVSPFWRQIRCHFWEIRWNSPTTWKLSMKYKIK